jgi:serine protease Do
MDTRNRIRAWTASIALAAALLVGGVVIAETHSTAASASASASAAKADPPIFAAPSKTPAVSAPMMPSYAPLIKEAMPEVVNIASSRPAKNNMDDQSNPLFDDPFLRQFFGNRAPQFRQQPGQRGGQQAPQQQKERGLGSGVIVGTNGYILTNNHVVDGATDIKVSLRDKREFTASVVGRDSKTDIAVLKINADHLAAIPLGDSSKVEVGDLAFAIGDPFGVGQTVTMGIVSATSRANLGIEDYEDFIQTDAAINPGNSGGALIDARGQLIGINTAILSGSGGNQGVGFAIPVNLAKRVMDQIVDHGHVVRGFLGATIQDVTPTMASALKMSDSNGVLIGDVTAKGPAAQAGIKPGDVITKINNQPVADASALRLQISQIDPGTTVPLTLVRNGSNMTVNAKLGELPNDRDKSAENSNDGDNLQGMQVEPLTPALRQQLHLNSDSTGVVISQLDPNSAAATSGLREGDVVEEINHKPINSVSDFEHAMQSAGDQPTLLHINRDGTGLFIASAAH